MASTDDKTADAPVVVNQASQPLTLNEFCTRLSQSDSRVELIGAFHSVEKRAGHFKDFESAYQARFTTFINQPA